MSDNKQDAATLRQISTMDVTKGDAATLQRIANQLELDAKRFEEFEQLQAIGKSCFESIADMVAALECDYDRLEELKEERDNWPSAAGGPGPQLWANHRPGDAEELAELEEAAGECTSREEAEQRIQEDPLSVQVRTDWYSPGEANGDVAPAEFEILLGTGGPATRIMGDLDEHGQPCRAWIEAQDWGKPWTGYVGGDSETLLTYCRCFYFGEG
jgi:hypothetical protein